MILYFVGTAISVLFRVFPLKLGYAFASVVGDLTFYLWPRGRTCLRQNLSHVLGKEACRAEIDAVAKKALRNYVRYLLEYCCLPALKPEEVTKRVTFVGWENLAKGLEGGNGCILVGLHMGYWEIAGGALVLGGYPLNVVVETLPSPRLDRFIQGRRRGKWMTVVPMESGVGEMVEALRRNEHLVLLIDIPNAHRGVEVTFCDAAIRMPRGPATLALKTGASIVPIASARGPDNTYFTFFGDPMSFEPSGSLGRDTKALTQEIMNTLEGYIKRYPEQCYMFRCMWSPQSRNHSQK